MAYLLDSNVFIQAKNLHYGFDFCPAFWDWVIANNASGSVYSVERVWIELERGDDELSDWARDRGDGFFLRPDEVTIPAFGRVSAWVNGQGYEPGAVSTFLQVADYFLVAFALAHGHTVVTHEKPDGSTRRVKIPNVCIGLRVGCVTPFEMLRKEHARFVLGHRE